MKREKSFVCLLCLQRNRLLKTSFLLMSEFYFHRKVQAWMDFNLHLFFYFFFLFSKWSLPLVFGKHKIDTLSCCSMDIVYVVPANICDVNKSLISSDWIKSNDFLLLRKSMYKYLHTKPEKIEGQKLNSIKFSILFINETELHRSQLNWHTLGWYFFTTVICSASNYNAWRLNKHRKDASIQLIRSDGTAIEINKEKSLSCAIFR